MKITSNADYKKALHTVYHLMNKGEENITDAEASQIKKAGKSN